MKSTILMDVFFALPYDVFPQKPKHVAINYYKHSCDRPFFIY